MEDWYHVSMGVLESEARTLRRKGYLQNAVLSALAVSGIIAVMMVAPNTLQLLGKFGNGKRRFAEQAHSAVGRLVKKGYARFEKRGDQRFLRITPAGSRALNKELQLSEITKQSTKPPRWDSRWRMVVFDVPERRKATRDRLRRTMLRYGFLRLQDSVWVYPYDCEEIIALLKAELHIGKDVIYAIVEKIENDGWIRRNFKLS